MSSNIINQPSGAETNKPYLTIQIKGLEEAKLLLDEFEESFNLTGGSMQTTLNTLGNEMVQDMQGNTPVDTGRLRSEIKYVTTSNSLEVSSPTPYAGFVNFGTRYMPPNPYFSTTVDTIGRFSFPEMLEKDALANWNRLVTQNKSV